MESSQLFLDLLPDANLLLYVGHDALEQRSPPISVDSDLLDVLRQTLGLECGRELGAQMDRFSICSGVGGDDDRFTPRGCLAGDAVAALDTRLPLGWGSLLASRRRAWRKSTDG